MATIAVIAEHVDQTVPHGRIELFGTGHRGFPQLVPVTHLPRHAAQA